ncbi:hypothetical protein HDV03_000861, partial [Kappamyces sp. JEL0829]
MASVAKAIASLLTQFANGTPIHKVSAPAFIHSPISGLQAMQEQVFSDGGSLEALAKIEDTVDPVGRIGQVLLSINNTHAQPHTDKPFNPVLGEFLDLEAKTEHGDTFHFVAEQIWHHPPVTGFRVSGENFVFEPKKGIDGSKGFRPGFNAVEIHFIDVINTVKTPSYCLTFKQPTIKVEPIFVMFSGKRAVYLHDTEFWITDDATGTQFRGSITKSFRVTGKLFDGNGELIDDVEGEIPKGIFFRSTHQKWIQSGPRVAMTITPSTPAVASDPFFTWNMWQKVFVEMNKRDFKKADKEKTIVEVAQRKRRQDSPAPYVSNYGFVCDYLDAALQSENGLENDWLKPLPGDIAALAQTDLSDSASSEFYDANDTAQDGWENHPDSLPHSQTKPLKGRVFVVLGCTALLADQKRVAQDIENQGGSVLYIAEPPSHWWNENKPHVYQIVSSIRHIMQTIDEPDLVDGIIAAGTSSSLLHLLDTLAYMETLRRFWKVSVHLGDCSPFNAIGLGLSNVIQETLHSPLPYASIHNSPNSTLVSR